MLAGASRSTPPYVWGTRPARLSSAGRAGRSFWSRRNAVMDSPELVAVPCPECGRSPVEVLKKIRNGRFLWCLRCRAIWVVES